MSRAAVPANSSVATAANVLSYPDQALFLALRGAGQEAVMQVVWLYQRPIDLDGLRRFHRNFGKGLLARRIERSAVPFGRHHWVTAPAITDSDLGMAELPRERDDLYEWADEQVELPLDPEFGPAWRMGVQPLSDGSTAVSLVVSHCIADGGALVIALIEAANGSHRELGYPSPSALTRRRAAIVDLRQTARDFPELARTIRNAAKAGRRRRKDPNQRAESNRRKQLTRRNGSTGGKRNPGVVTDIARMTSLSAFVDLAEWDARTERLGGNSFSMVAAFAAKVAEHLGRTRASDGKVTLMIPVNERTDFAETAGNVVAIANVSVTPAEVTGTLTGLRTAIRDGLKAAREVPDEMVALLPLIPFVPKRAFGRIADATFGFSTDLPVTCSNMGDLPDQVNRVDGTDADFMCIRGVDRNASTAVLERRGGVLTVGSCRVGGRIILGVISHQPGADNSLNRLRDVVLQTLADFELPGEIV